MPVLTPTSPDELAQALKAAASRSQTVSVFGRNSKRLMAGPVLPADVVISTAGLRRILQYETHDLTVSVEAGMPFVELQTILARNHQMIALDPPFVAQATAGGLVASNSSGPMRCAFGTARDLVIGMTFATLAGRVVKTGGMVVKNVAGLDMGKLMIGSFGTLAVITSVNFRVHSTPEETRTFLFTFSKLESAIQKRNATLQGVLRPIAMDLISPAAAARMDVRGYALAIRAGGSRTVLERYTRDLSGGDPIEGQPEAALWRAIRDFSPEFLRRQPSGVVLRISTPLSETEVLFRLVSGPCISRAASGTTYIYLSSWQGVPGLWNAARERGWNAVVEFANDEDRNTKDLWLNASSDRDAAAFAMMKRIKTMFDSEKLLNRSRLYGRI